MESACIFFLVVKAWAKVTEYHAAQTTQTETWTKTLLTCFANINC